MTNTESTITVDPHIIPQHRDGKPFEEKLLRYIIVALDNAVEQIITPNGSTLKQPTPEQLRKRMNLANKIEGVVEGEMLTMSKEEYDLIAKCVSSHFNPMVSMRVLHAMDAIQNSMH